MKKIYCILFSLGLAPFISCIEDTGGDCAPGADVPGDAKTIVFTLSNSSTLRTRATVEDAEHERAITGVDIFFYDANGETCLYKPDNVAVDQDRATITIPEVTYLGLTGASYRIFVLANYHGAAESLAGKSLDGLKQSVIENTEGRAFNLASPPDDFIMSGEVPGLVTLNSGDAASRNLGNVTLRRTAAKIVVDMLNATIYDSYDPETGAGVGAPTFTATDARVSIQNYLDAAYLDSPDTPYSNTLGGDAGYDAYKKSDNKILTPASADGVVTSFLMDAANALYTYPNDWSEDIEKESFVILEVDWLSTATDVQKTYYYRIPFSYIVPNEDAGEHTNRIRSNYIYEFKVNVSELGGLDPTLAVDLAANFDIIDWNTGDIDVSILEYHYLFVYNAEATTYTVDNGVDGADYTWDFRSSLPLGEDDITVSKVWSRVYTAESGSGTVPDGREEIYPGRVTVSARGESSFSIDGVWVPDNNVPLYIEITVTNNANLSVPVTLTVLPERYVTANASIGSYDNSNNPLNCNANNPGYSFPVSGAYNSPTGTGGGGTWGSNAPNGVSYANGTLAYPELGRMGGFNNVLNNLNFYEVKTSSVSGQEVWIPGAGWNGNFPILVGDPTEPADNPFGGNAIAGWEYIVTNADMQNVVSPSFIVASRRGAVGASDWNTMWERCRRYRESEYPAGTWRVPTYAELALLAVLQNTETSAVKELYNQAQILWTAHQGYALNIAGTGQRYDEYTDGIGQGVVQSNGNQWVRCVRDTWRDYPQDRYGVYGDYRDDRN